jgi:hypothetical protein
MRTKPGPGLSRAFTLARYARRYLAEVQYRFNRRADLAAMTLRLAVAVAQARSCSKRMVFGKAEVRT